jgi:tRNA pseudouridine32 synthase / 23S rRNA pseudouridine746 synthase
VNASAVDLLPLHDDASLLAFDKPAGLLCVAGRGADKQDCLAARAQQRWPDALVVHRLDMATSGVVLMARSAAAQRRLGHAFAQREVDKRYVAVVDGLLDADTGTIALPLAADWPRRPLQKVDPAGGRPSTTHWRVISRDPAAHTTRLELQPVTGRSHQLRVHLLAIGHAIVGDALYAPPAVRDRAPRLLLHAHTLQLAHPDGGAMLRIEAPLPF